MKYIKGFDSIRAISIILVISSHLGLYMHLPKNEFSKERLWLLLSGNNGVQIFFTLSGFLITMILLAEQEKFRTISLQNFYVRRFLRLLPPLIVFYLVVFVLMKANLIENDIHAILYSIFYVYNFVPNNHYTGELGHTWSLALEEQFYLFWPIIIKFILKKQVVILLILSIILLCLISIHIYPMYSVFNNYRVERWFIPAIAPVLIGSYFAILKNNQLSKWQIYFNSSSKRLLFIGVVLSLFPLYSPYLAYSFLFQSIGTGALLVWIMNNQESHVIRFINYKPLSYIGKISYGLYVYQGLFLRTGPGSDLWIQQFPQNLFLTLSVAVVSYHFLEKPILLLKNNFRTKSK